MGFFSCGVFSKSSEARSGDGKISFMLVDTSGTPLAGAGAGNVLATMKKWTGVEVDFKYIPTDEYDAKIKEVFEHPDSAPMIMHVSKMNQFEV